MDSAFFYFGVNIFEIVFASPCIQTELYFIQFYELRVLLHVKIAECCVNT
jgi:hypothetical protein